MIILRDLTKVYNLQGRQKIVADNINAVFPSRKSVALMGRNGAGKSTLLRMIAGTSDPTSGDILSDGTISFPVGFAGSFHPDLTGAQNTLFVARIYGADTEALIAYVEDFAELGSHFNLPVRSYSSGMRSRLAFGVSMGLKFDTYLIDEITAVGDADFKRKSRTVFMERMQQAGAIFVSHSVRMMREMCDAGAVLENGQLTYYEDIEEAIDQHMSNMHGSDILDMPGEGLINGADAVSGDQLLPAGTRLLYGIGAPHAGLDWLSKTVRKSRKCLCQPQKEIHYFDILAGHHPAILKRRVKTLHRLSGSLNPETDQSQNNFKTLQQMNAVNALLSIHASAPEAQNRHKAYVDYLLIGRKNQPVLCDFTPSYCTLDADDFSEMASIGECLFLFIMRDPANRVWTDICAQHASKALSQEAYHALCLKSLTRLLDGGGLAHHRAADYARTLDALESVVGRNQILCLFYETLFKQASVDRLCRFIGIPERPMEPIPEEPAPLPLPRPLADRLRAALAPQYAAMKARFKDSLPAAWQDATTLTGAPKGGSDHPQLAG